MKKKGGPDIQMPPEAALRLQASIIILFSIAVYFNALFNGFVYDDGYQVLGNPWIKDIRFIPKIFVSQAWGFFSGDSTNYYRPIMHLIYMLNYYIYGLKPWGFHLTNILLHAGASVLVLLITMKLFDGNRLAGARSRLSAPFMAALLFAAHPIHTEVVAWVAALPELSFTLFFLISLYLYICEETDEKVRYSLSAASFLLAVLCKETALVLPVILMAYDRALRNLGWSVSDCLKRYSPYLAVAGVYFIVRIHALGGLAPVKVHRELSSYQYLINVFPLFMDYLIKLIFPIKLNAFHVLHPLTSILELRGILSVMLLASILALVLFSFKKDKVIFFGLLCIIVPLLPCLYIPGLGKNTFAERYLYLPSFGFVILLASLFEWLKAVVPGSAVKTTAIFILLLGLYTIGTVNRNAIWKDDFTLFSDTVKKSPDGAIPHVSLGFALSERGEVDKAIDQYEIAISLDPYYTRSRINLGAEFMRKRQTDKAIEQYQIALRLDPKSPDAHYNLGIALYAEGLRSQAIEQYQIALNLRPDFAKAHNNLGIVYGNLNFTDKAIEEFQAAIRADPDNWEAHYNLGAAYREKGLIDMAIEHFEKAARLNPADPDLLAELSDAYELKRLGKRR